MAQFAECLCLAPELQASSLQARFVRQGVRVQLLDRAQAVGEQVTSEVDCAHSAFAEDRLDLVAALEHLASLHRHRVGSLSGA